VFETLGQENVNAILGHGLCGWLWVYLTLMLGSVRFDMEDSTGPGSKASVHDRLAQTEHLVAAAKGGEPDAFETLLAAHLDDVRAFIRLQVDVRVRQREAVSDFVQSACREVLEGLPRFEYRGPESFRAWLFTTVLNKVREKHVFHRAQKRDVAREAPPAPSVSNDIYSSLCSPQASPSQHAIGTELSERIERAIDQLPEDQRQVLLLSRVVGLSHAEIAERMERSELATRSLLSRALVRLLAVLEQRTGD
jgi:RNA polymerase sigma-70 factor (ECF subfamily)